MKFIAHCKVKQETGYDVYEMILLLKPIYYSVSCRPVLCLFWIRINYHKLCTYYYLEFFVSECRGFRLPVLYFVQKKVRDATSAFKIAPATRARMKCFELVYSRNVGVETMFISLHVFNCDVQCAAAITLS